MNGHGTSQTNQTGTRAPPHLAPERITTKTLSFLPLNAFCLLSFSSLHPSVHPPISEDVPLRPPFSHQEETDKHQHQLREFQKNGRTLTPCFSLLAPRLLSTPPTPEGRVASPPTRHLRLTVSVRLSTNPQMCSTSRPLQTNGIRAHPR